MPKGLVAPSGTGVRELLGKVFTVEVPGVVNRGYVLEASLVPGVDDDGYVPIKPLVMFGELPTPETPVLRPLLD